LIGFDPPSLQWLWRGVPQPEFAGNRANFPKRLMEYCVLGFIFLVGLGRNRPEQVEADWRLSLTRLNM
jgi:hypothetical protein